MDVTQESIGTSSLFSVSGSVDIYTSPELRGKLKTALDQKKPRIVVDLKHVTFVDSSGLATLIEALQKVTAYQGKLALCNLGPPVMAVFQLANLDSIFDIRLSRQAALEG